jgi:hypothetical protein
MPFVLLKLLIDRSNPFWLQKSFEDKLGAIIVNGAGRLGGIELCAKTIQHYYYDCGIVTVPFYACFNRTIKHHGERLPVPLSKEITSPLDTLVAEIHALANKLFLGKALCPK